MGPGGGDPSESEPETSKGENDHFLNTKNTQRNVSPYLSQESNQVLSPSLGLKRPINSCKTQGIARGVYVGRAEVAFFMDG